MVDLRPLLASIIVKNQLLVIWFELLEAIFQTVQAFPLQILRAIGLRSRERRRCIAKIRQAIQTYLGAPGAALIFQENKSRNNVAVVGRRRVGDRAFLSEAPRNPVQRFICEIFGVKAVLAIEVENQPPPHFQISLAAGVYSLVKPV